MEEYEYEYGNVSSLVNSPALGPALPPSLPVPAITTGRLSLSSSTTSLQTGSKEALLDVDAYLRRQHALHVLDADMIVRGEVYDKTSTSVVINLIKVYPSASMSPGEVEEISKTGPRLSSIRSVTKTVDTILLCWDSLGYA